MKVFIAILRDKLENDVYIEISLTAINTHLLYTCISVHPA